ncbi:MAG: hypothetical protein AAGG48_32285 [Planctomycetota bacterium]
MPLITIQEFDLDEALRVYLGGPPDSGAIQIGMKDERLRERFGESVNMVKIQVDGVLRAVEEHADAGFPNGHSPASWIASELPQLSLVACRKIHAHIQYRIQH